MATSQDHKRRDEGDLGPNTGGMGAYSPAPVVTPAVERRILRRGHPPDARRHGQRRRAVHRVSLCGPHDRRDGAPKVIEFNVRFGDPETQPIMMRLNPISWISSKPRSTDDSTAEHRLGRRPAIGVVLAAHGYPGKVRSGDVIHGVDNPLPFGAKIFHAGTKFENGQSGYVRWTRAYRLRARDRHSRKRRKQHTKR